MIKMILDGAANWYWQYPLLNQSVLSGDDKNHKITLYWDKEMQYLLMAYIEAWKPAIGLSVWELFSAIPRKT